MNDSTEPTVNVPLLRKAVEWVEKQDALPKRHRQWEQSIYAVDEAAMVGADLRDEGCGTCYCVAGYLASLVDPLAASSTSHAATYATRIAAKALGAESQVYGSGLFAPGNTAADVRRIAESLAGERL